MTYRAGIGPSLAQALGVTDAASVPTLTCDVVNCNYRIEVKPTRGGMPAWLRNGTAPRGWRACPQLDGKKQHLCPECAAALKDYL